MNIIRNNKPNQYLLLADLFCITFSFFLATWIRYGAIIDHGIKHMRGTVFIILILIYITIYYMFDTYTGILKRGFLKELYTVIKINALLAVVLTFVLFLLQEGATYSRLFFLIFFMVNIMTTYLVRAYFKKILYTIYKNGRKNNKLMVVTTSDQAKDLLNNMKKENDWRYEVTYLTILDKQLVGQSIEGIPIKANKEDMFEIARKEVVDGVFISIPNDFPLPIKLEEIIYEFVNMGVAVNLSINTFGLNVNEKTIREISGYHVLTFSTRLFTESQLLLKRVMDIIGGIIGCLFTLILTIILTPFIKLESPGPVFFSQIRVGQNGRRFKIYKFRSMYMDAEKRKAELLSCNEMKGFMFKMKDDPRITKIGKFLRKTSLDEFPQFFNILRGDMSLVGTRPPTEDEFLQYECRHKRRLSLKSGLTGLWQISGRSDIDNFEDVVKLDLEYIDNWSLIMDTKILLKTVAVVLLGRGSR